MPKNDRIEGGRTRVLTPYQIGMLIANENWGPVKGAGTRRMGQTASAFLDTAIAVCLAESGGNTAAKNPSSSASGLWQIMASVHADKIGGRDIFDPVVNTEVAHKIYDNAGGWSPWEAYNTGAYKKYLGHGKEVYDKLAATSDADLKSFILSVAAGLSPGGAAAALLAGGEVKWDIPGAIRDLSAKIVQGGKIAGWFLLALTLILAGVWVLFQRSPTGKAARDAAIGAAGTFATGGASKAAKAVK